MEQVKLLIGEEVKFAKQGWALFDTGDTLLQVQCIDEPKSWTNDYIVPQLKDDKAAWVLAEKEGFILNTKGEVVARLKNKFGNVNN